jgi:hypothetical protein
MISNFLFSNEVQFTRDRDSNTRYFHVWVYDNPNETAEINYQHCFSVNVWDGISGDELFATELPTLLEIVQIQTCCQMYCQNSGAPADFIRIVELY